MWEQNQSKYEAEIAALYGISPLELQLVSIEGVANSLPLFSKSETSLRPVSIIDPANNRIIYAGDSFDEPSQNGALRSGRIAVERILQTLQSEK